MPFWAGDVYSPFDTWAKRGACRPKRHEDGTVEYFTELFFNSYEDEDNLRVEHNRPQRLAKAKAMCDGCPVRFHCLIWALRHGVHFDFVAGRTTWSQRKRILADLRWWARTYGMLVSYPWYSQDEKE